MCLMEEIAVILRRQCLHKPTVKKKNRKTNNDESNRMDIKTKRGWSSN